MDVKALNSVAINEDPVRLSTSLSVYRKRINHPANISIMELSLKGVIPILLTPFDDAGHVDYEDLRKMIKFYLDSGVDGLACLGEVSETRLLEEDERREILTTVVREVRGKVPVIAGIGRDSETLSLEAAERASDHDLGAILVSPPHDPQIGREAIAGYFEKVSGVSTVPIIILDNPSLGYPIIGLDTIRRITGRCENIRYIKVEDQPSTEKIELLRKEFGQELGIFGASHGRNILWEMELGIEGILTSAPVPSYLIDIWNNFQRGNKLLARELYFATLPLSYYLPDRTIAVKKEILKHYGVIKTSYVRKQGDNLSARSVRNLVDLIEWTSARVNEIERNSA